jgi:thymidylate kinase
MEEIIYNYIMNIERNIQYIYIDGVDLSGKSTTARELSDLYTPPPIMRRNVITDPNPIYRESQLKRSSLTQSQLFESYRQAIDYDLEHFFPSESLVIQDSLLIVRMLSYLYAVEQIKHDDLEQKLLQYSVFSLSFVLTASYEERLQRLNKRRSENPQSVSNADQMIEQDPEKFFAIERCFLDLTTRYFQPIIIDTNIVSAVEAAHIIYEYTQ